MIHYRDDTLMPFGKYKGLPMIEVPASYLIYLYEDSPQPLTHIALKRYIEENMDVLRMQINIDKQKRYSN